ncbi:PIN domain-containing protein, partial [Erythrobacter sp.]|uniref:PIN domain-containing protein n=1 Tax=Erythrobacter sp. TaxID=1042 RepID=UPI00311E0EFA
IVNPVCQQGLDTPSLFNLPKEIKPRRSSLVLNTPKTGPAPLFLFDLNVLFDVVMQRKDYAAVSRVFAAAFENEVRLAISEEFVIELQRQTERFPHDQLLNLASALPIVPKPPKAIADQYHNDLAKLVFPDRHRAGSLTEQDRSDIGHLTTAIVEDVAGFVTSEKAILRNADDLRLRYGIEVVSPLVFASVPDDQLASQSSLTIEHQERSITTRELTDADRLLLESSANRLGISPSIVRVALGQGTSRSPRTRVVVRGDRDLIAAATWQPGATDEAGSQLHVFVDMQDAAAELAVDHLLDLACRSASTSKDSFLWIETSPSLRLVRERALNFGFQVSSHASGQRERLVKVSFGRPITAGNWGGVGNLIRSRFEISLPVAAPTFVNPDDTIEIGNPDGSLTELRLRTLEDFLGPTIFALEGRPAIIVPIWPSYAEALFQGTLQPTLLAGKRAGLSPQKCYLSNAKNAARVPDNGLIVFFESAGKAKSKGRSAATAIARVQRRFLATEHSAANLAQLRGVLSQADIQTMANGEDLCVTEFDNLLKFRNAVPLARLKEIGCADGANLVTARALSSESLQKLIEVGEPVASANH